MSNKDDMRDYHYQSYASNERFFLVQDNANNKCYFNNINKYSTEIKLTLKFKISYYSFNTTTQRKTPDQLIDRDMSKPDLELHSKANTK